MTGALVYDWDSNCQRIHDRLHTNFSHIRRETGELEHTSPQDQKNLLFYFKKWHYNNELFLRCCEEISSRKRVIETLSKKGYGVSTALGNDMGSIQHHEVSECLQRLSATFDRTLDMVKSQIYLPAEQISNRNSSYIMRELCKRLGEDFQGHLHSVTPQVMGLSPAAHTIPLSVFRQIQQDTPPRAHISIMNRMFLELTEESGTIMEGSIGEINVDSPQHLKALASRNIRELFNYLYDTIDEDLGIDLEWIKRIHYFLTRDLDISHAWKAGEFRQEDFSDRSGLTLDFGNFDRGLQELGALLERVNWKTESLHAFSSNLARVYYLLLGIHPFTDSNGRAAKCLVNHLMMRRGLPPLLFSVRQEILYLPRYGGSALMMEHYFEHRLAVSIERYLFERDKIRHFGNLEKHFFKVDFDSGFYFRHLNGMFPLIEVDFKVYMIPGGNALAAQYINQCRIVLPDENRLQNLIIYYGFTGEGGGDWAEKGEMAPTISWKRGPDSNNISFFIITCFIPVGPHLARYDALEISLACPACNLVFNNKGLNYRYQMDRSHLTRLAGDLLTRRILSGEAYRDADAAPLRRVRDHLEHRATEIFRNLGIGDDADFESLRAELRERFPDVAGDYQAHFLPSLFELVQKHNLTGKGDPAHTDNIQLVQYCARRIAPNAEKLFGYS